MNADNPLALGAPAPAVGIGLDLRARLTVLRRRLFFVLATLVCSVLVGALLTVHAARIYRAVTTVLIDTTTPEVLADVREVYDLGAGYWASKEYYQTQYNVIRSRLVAGRVVERLGLAVPALAEELAALSPARAAPLPPGLGHRLALLGLDPAAGVAALRARVAGLDPIGAVQARVRVNPVRDSRLVQVAIEDTSPERAALLANAVADAYLEVNLDQKVDMTRTAVDWLRAQVAQLKAKLDASETALQTFRREHEMVSVAAEDAQAGSVQALAQLSGRLATARAEGLASASRQTQLHEAGAAATLEEVRGSPVIQRLKVARLELRQEEAALAERYTEAHPARAAVRQKLALVEQDLATEVHAIAAGLAQDDARARDTERRLAAELARVTRAAVARGDQEVAYGRLRRERDHAAALYETILKREKEAQLTQMLRVNNVRKLDVAQPPRRPVRPSIKINMVAALLVGLIGGVAVAFAVDYLDNTVKSQDQIEQVIGLPFLGIIPTVKAPRGAAAITATERDLFITKHPRSVSAECWRTVRTNIMFMSPDRPARTLVVSSSAPLEGKSTTVINLSITMALLGTRTLVVDTDMRRPRLHHSFGVANTVGISSLVVGDASIDAAIHPTGVERLDVLTCGPLPPNPAELLHTARFAAVLSELSARYDRIIFDSPPVAAVTDALVLASMADGVVMVVHANHSSWQATLQTRRRFEDVGSTILGVVLNNVDLDKSTASDYYYYRNYRYGYGEGARA